MRGRNGCITPSVSGSPTLSEGTKSEKATTLPCWGEWLHHPHRVPNTERADKIRKRCLTHAVNGPMHRCGEDVANRKAPNTTGHRQSVQRSHSPSRWVHSQSVYVFTMTHVYNHRRMMLAPLGRRMFALVMGAPHNWQGLGKELLCHRPLLPWNEAVHVCPGFGDHKKVGSMSFRPHMAPQG